MKMLRIYSNRLSVVPRACNHPRGARVTEVATRLLVDEIEEILQLRMENVQEYGYSGSPRSLVC